LGFPVRYQPVTDYAALVTAFGDGDVKLAWFGGLTGVQARLETPGAQAVAQRPIDKNFRSVFVVGPGVNGSSLQDLKGKSFTFGSESSTSGHLMPRYFLQQAGVNPDKDFAGAPGYSGSHDKTWKLVEAGSFQAGALSSSVWDSAVSQRQVDTSKVHEIVRTPPYYDYHWLAHPDLDKVYGPGTKDKIVKLLLTMNTAGPAEKHVLDLFQTDSFIPSDNSNYGAIEQVAQSLGLIGH
jgi:phosphonate transport system substrate-binding protein